MYPNYKTMSEDKQADFVVFLKSHITRQLTLW